MDAFNIHVVPRLENGDPAKRNFCAILTFLRNRGVFATARNFAATSAQTVLNLSYCCQLWAACIERGIAT